MQLIIIFTVLIFHYILFQTRGDVCVRYCDDLTPCKGHVQSRSRSCAPGRRRHEETEWRRRRLPATSLRSPRSPLPPPPTPEGSLGSTGGRIGRVKPDPAPRRSTGLLQHRPPPGSSRIPLVLDELRRSKRSPAPSAGAPSSPVGNIPPPPPSPPQRKELRWDQLESPFQSCEKQLRAAPRSAGAGSRRAAPAPRGAGGRT